RGAKAERAGRKPSRMGANVDRAALDEAVTLFTRYGDDIVAEGARRPDGAEARPVVLALTDKQRAAAALDAAGAQALDAPRAAADAFGETLAWAIRHLAGLGRKTAGRPALEPAPVQIRAAWAALAAGDEDAVALAPLAALAACLQAERARALAQNNRLTAGLLAALQGASVTKLIGSESVSFSKTTLRDYVFAADTGRKATLATADLDAARMDRLLLTLALLRCVEEGDGAAADAPAALLSPLAIDPDSPGIKALAPTPAMLTALGAYLQSGDAVAADHARAFARLMEERRFFSNAGLMKLWRQIT
ncbi:MAG: hypothetical protein AAF909_13400, partial [Pseudomonadota bacterium]